MPTEAMGPSSQDEQMEVQAEEGSPSLLFPCPSKAPPLKRPGPVGAVGLA